jgi:hypothetical protein
VNQRKPDLKLRNQNSGDVLAETRFSLWCLGGWILGRVRVRTSPGEHINSVRLLSSKAMFAAETPPVVYCPH